MKYVPVEGEDSNGKQNSLWAKLRLSSQLVNIYLFKQIINLIKKSIKIILDD